MRTTLGVVMISNAVLFFFGAAQHDGLPLGLFHEPKIIPASIVETTCGLFLMCGGIAILDHLSSGCSIALIGNLVALGGVFAGYGRTGSWQGTSHSEKRFLSSHYAGTHRCRRVHPVLGEINVAAKLTQQAVKA